MTHAMRRNVLVLALAALPVLTSMACAVYAEPSAYPATAAAYAPMYYDGFPVYYDAYGLPFYYLDGVQLYVPRADVRFGTLVAHYRTHREGYERWYAGEGYRYRSRSGGAPTVRSSVARGSVSRGGGGYRGGGGPHGSGGGSAAGYRR